MIEILIKMGELYMWALRKLAYAIGMGFVVVGAAMMNEPYKIVDRQ